MSPTRRYRRKLKCPRKRKSIRKHHKRHKRHKRTNKKNNKAGSNPPGPFRRGRKTEFERFDAQSIVDDIVENQIVPLEDEIAECGETRTRLENEREDIMQPVTDAIARIDAASQENERRCNNLQKSLDQIQKNLFAINKERQRLSASPIWW